MKSTKISLVSDEQLRARLGQDRRTPAKACPPAYRKCFVFSIHCGRCFSFVFSILPVPSLYFRAGTAQAPDVFMQLVESSNKYYKAVDGIIVQTAGDFEDRQGRLQTL
jgi:hypothetical protein